MSGPRVLLVGMMGAGKTTVGRLLAERTGWPYLDNDELLRRSARGTSTPDLLARCGVTALRRAEALALHAAAESPPPLVASVAAGVVEDPADRALLAQAGEVVYLRARLETLARRVGSGEDRPWLAGGPLAALRGLYAGREPLYREVASVVVDVDEVTPAQVCDRILAALAAGGREGPEVEAR